MDRQQFKVVIYDLTKSDPAVISDEITALLNRIEVDGYDVVTVQTAAIAGTTLSHMQGLMPQLVVTIYFVQRPQANHAGF